MPIIPDITWSTEELGQTQGGPGSGASGNIARSVLLCTSAPPGPGVVLMQAEGGGGGGDPGPARVWYSPNGTNPLLDYNSPGECAAAQLNPPTSDYSLLPNNGGCIAGAIYCAYGNVGGVPTYGNIGIALR